MSSIDIFTIGHNFTELVHEVFALSMFKYPYLRNVQANRDGGFIIPLAESMMNSDPVARSTAVKVLKRWHRMSAPIGFWGRRRCLHS